LLPSDQGTTGQTHILQGQNNHGQGDLSFVPRISHHSLLHHDINSAEHFPLPSVHSVDVSSASQNRTPLRSFNFDGGGSTPSNNSGSNDRDDRNDVISQKIAEILPKNVVNDNGQPLKQTEMVMLQQFATFASDTEFMKPFKAMLNAKRKATAAISSEPSAKRVRANDNGSPGRIASSSKLPGCGNFTAGMRPLSKDLSVRMEARIKPPPPSNPFWNNTDTYCMAALKGAEIATFEMSLALLEECEEFGTVFGFPAQNSPDNVADSQGLLFQKLNALAFKIRSAMTDCMVGRIKSGALRSKEDEASTRAGVTAEKSRAGSVTSMNAELSQLVAKRRGTVSTVDAESAHFLPPGHEVVSPLDDVPFSAKLAYNSDTSRNAGKGSSQGSRRRSAAARKLNEQKPLPFSLAPVVLNDPPLGVEPPAPVNPVNTSGPGAGLLIPRMQEKDGHNWMLMKQTGRWKYIGRSGPKPNAPKSTGSSASRGRRRASQNRASSANDDQHKPKGRALAPAFARSEPSPLEPFPTLPRGSVASDMANVVQGHGYGPVSQTNNQNEVITHLLQQQQLMQQQMLQQQQMMGMLGNPMGGLQQSPYFGPLQPQQPSSVNHLFNNGGSLSQIDPSLAPMNMPMMSQTPTIGLGIRTPHLATVSQPQQHHQISGNSQLFDAITGSNMQHFNMLGQSQDLPDATHQGIHMGSAYHLAQFDQFATRSGSSKHATGDSDDVFGP
jgi:hypothetical protein